MNHKYGATTNFFLVFSVITLFFKKKKNIALFSFPLYKKPRYQNKLLYKLNYVLFTMCQISLIVNKSVFILSNFSSRVTRQIFFFFKLVQ